ncbi:CRISPR-associated endonuclease Cas3'' [Thiohalocapsa marina]|uniref:CRISPR-associated endonuclease Cas3 n=1 Tax=Thiohalocapsa marina TaxID=424902 RepID=A0A5M8FKU8_9GAMM|nr:CRISPR-associated endonuclease Cas3'' [Thiohalocapsa marina]KAA6185359.1 CRISPR-associated endonuclease Cas3'' [Thiohalocapsa marina]
MLSVLKKDQAAFLLAHSNPQHSDDPSQWEPLLGASGHLHRVTRRTLRFARSAFGQLPELAVLGLLAGRWHDLGKFSDAFQQYLRGVGADSHKGERTGRVDHSSAGAQHAMATLAPPFNAMLAYAIAGHHAGLLNGLDSQRTCLKARLRKTDLPPWREAVPEKLLTGTGIAIPRGISGTKPEIAFQLGFATRMLFSCLVDADFLATESFMNPVQSAQRPKGKADFAVIAAGFDARLDERFATAQGRVAEARARVLDACRRQALGRPGLYSLTVPTGGGKTLSSLTFALKHCAANGLNRIIYAIPFTSIIEQTAEVFRAFLEGCAEDVDQLILEHHSNFDPELETTRTRLASENWDAPLVVTTNVQLFESLFANKPVRCRKLHRIANSVIVLDEVQTLPVTLLAPCLRVIELLVNQYGCTVVLCTATQPALERREDFRIGLPAPRPIIEDPVSLYRALQRVELRDAGSLDCPTLAVRMSACEQGLAIVNTRAHAAAVFEALQAHAGADGCFHLSAAMTPDHRSRRLAEIRQRLADGAVCRVVSTQLIEAGVDVDFPVVWRALAGLDSVAQAAGRCNREGQRDTGITWIFRPEEPAFARLFGTIKTGASATSQVIDAGHHQDLLGLDAIEHYFRLHYWSREQDWDKQKISDCSRVGDPKLPLDVDFATMAERFRFIDDTQRPVLIGWDDESRALIDVLRRLDGLGRYPDRKLSRRLQRLSASVAERRWKQALQANQIELLCDRFAVLLAPDLYYDRDLGLRLDADPVYDAQFLIQ